VNAFQLIILPVILVALFLGGIFWVVARLALASLATMRAEKAAAEVPVNLLRKQADTIDNVISELEANKLSYEYFPKELYDRLIDVHAEWADPSSKGIR
jgi:hypothetical protein